MAHVLVVDDDRSIRHMIRQALESEDMQVTAAESADEAMTVLKDPPDVVLLDIILPDRSGLDVFEEIQKQDGRLPVIFMTGGGTSDTAIEAMKLGAYDYLAKPLDLNHVREVVEQAIEIRRLMTVRVGVGETIAPEDKGDQIVGRSPQMQDVFKSIGRVAPQDVTVLIRGESGTGKELVARAIYQHSKRSDDPFLAVNCAAIPEHLLESELFGHEKGAFTGADRKRIGKFEQCSGGTLFLDEVGDMPSILQSKILRALQEQTFQRVGGNDEIHTDVRVIAATNRDLESMVKTGDFREDLLYRLNGYVIDLPALRDRGDDIKLLLEHFLARIGKEIGRSIEMVSPEAMEILREYPWPGNVRELESAVRQSLLQTTGTVLAPEFLPETMTHRKTRSARATGGDGGGQPSPSSAAGPEGGETELQDTHDLASFILQRLDEGSSELYAETLELMERFLLGRVLERTGGNQSEASRILGITRGSLRNKIRNLGITIERTVDAN